MRLGRFFPPDFPYWGAFDKKGRSVAHVAARYGTLAEGFKLWGIATPEGWTVAHEAARYRNLPSIFADWTLAAPDGWTVAHEAARSGELCRMSDSVWALADKDGLTVGQTAAFFHPLPKQDRFAPPRRDKSLAVAMALRRRFKEINPDILGDDHDD